MPLNENVSKETTGKVSKEILDVLVPAFRSNSLVKGRVSGKYGDLFSIKVEAVSNDGVSKEIGKKILDEVHPQILEILKKNELEVSKTSWSYGELFSLTIKANAILMKNGINLKSDDAELFSLIAWRYDLKDEALGKEATINGKSYILAGAKVNNRSGDVKWLVKDEEGKLIYLLKESVITYWGGKAEEPIVSPLSVLPKRTPLPSSENEKEAARLIREAEDAIQTY